MSQLVDKLYSHPSLRYKASNVTWLRQQLEFNNAILTVQLCAGIRHRFPGTGELLRPGRPCSQFPHDQARRGQPVWSSMLQWPSESPSPPQPGWLSRCPPAEALSLLWLEGEVPAFRGPAVNGECPHPTYHPQPSWANLVTCQVFAKDC